MPKKTYSPNAKARILEAAVNIFAQNGFDGSRVDQIAKAANVPKSLIYYHFKSKDSILDTLVENCMEQYREILKTVAKDHASQDPHTLLERIRTVYWDFLEKNEDIVRVISMESLKKGSPKAGIAFKFTELIIEIEKEFLKDSTHLSEKNFQEKMVTEFFTSQVPVVLFFCLRKHWADSFQIDSNRLTQYFLNAYDATYGSYRRQELNQ